uniref:Uncharacterized protein n=1 Tax=Pyxicephalus adspersus TaxID=30357 RepID=A0AAV3A9V2_PYXAD|nr:TPA: hypothetical protein GDO54_011670 [Pyxicephalus adspersus]
MFAHCPDSLKLRQKDVVLTQEALQLSSQGPALCTACSAWVQKRRRYWTEGSKSFQYWLCLDYRIWLSRKKRKIGGGFGG